MQLYLEQVAALNRRIAELEDDLSRMRASLPVTTLITEAATLAAQKRIADLEAALAQYADRENWGYYDGSGCLKGVGTSTEACVLGPEVAEQALLQKGEGEG